MSHIFISYSRKDLQRAGRIVAALAENKLDTWIDWKSIAKGERWEQEIYRGIEEADAFLFLISPDSVLSDMCNKEIEHALANNKRMLPVVIRDTELQDIHPEISKRNWIFCRSQRDDFGKAIREIRKTIRTDYDWVRYHTELQVKALKWEQKRDASRLLRGKELQEAEEQLAGSEVNRNPSPTGLQRRFALTSRREEIRRSNHVKLLAALVAVVMMILGGFGFLQARTATQQRDRALSLALAVQANEHLESDLDLSLLLSIEANKRKSTYQAKDSLLSGLQEGPNILQYLHGHSAGVVDVAFSPMNSLLASADSKEILLWDISDPNQVTRVGPALPETLRISSIAFSPTTMLLAVGCDDNTISLWDVTDPLQPKRIEPQLTGGANGENGDSNFSYITSVAFSPDAKYLVAGSLDGSMMFWDVSDVEQPRKLTTLKGETGLVTKIAFAKNGRMLAAASMGSTITLLDVSRFGKPIVINSWSTNHTGGIYDLAISPDGKILASELGDGSIGLWEIGNPLKPLLRRIITTGQVENHLAFDPTGRFLLTTGTNRTIVVWNISNPDYPNKVLEMTGHQDRVTDIEFDAGGTTFATGSPDKNVILWDLSILNPLVIDNPIPGDVEAALNPQGNILATSDYDPSTGEYVILLWDISKDWRPTRNGAALRGHSDRILSISFNPSGNVLASADNDNTIVLWDMSNPAQAKELARITDQHSDGISTIKFSPNGKILASGGYDKKIILWDVSNPGHPFQIVQYPLIAGEVMSLSFSPNGRLMATAHWDGTIILRDLSNPGQRVDVTAQLKGHLGGVDAVSFSPDGKILASGSYDKTVILWDVSDPQKPLQITRPLTGHSDRVSSVGFSPDGKTLVSAGWDGKIILWDLSVRNAPFSVGYPLRIINSHAIVYDSLFSRDGKFLVSSGHGGYTLIWQMDTQAWIDRACKIANRNMTNQEWTQYIGDTPYEPTCPTLPIPEE